MLDGVVDGVCKVLTNKRCERRIPCCVQLIADVVGRDGPVNGHRWYANSRGVVVAECQHENCSVILASHELVVEVLADVCDFAIAVEVDAGFDVIVVVARGAVVVL